jgi:hypothetical protein
MAGFFCMGIVCVVGIGLPTLGLVFSSSEPLEKAPGRTLTFAERVAYQRAIEEVYWGHRIWPKENPGPKPPLDAIISQRQIEKKVEDFLRKSQLVTDKRGSPITASELQAEMDRMASHSKQPEVLCELFEALGNAPFVIAECLARPALAERLVTNVRLTSASRWSDSRVPNAIAMSGVNYTLPKISQRPGGCTDDSWTATTVASAPDIRANHTAVWTGSEMIIWGGYNTSGGQVNTLNTGGKYNPSTDTWTSTSTTNAPIGREFHAAVWTGSEMIVWGGYNYPAGDLNTGGRYNPTSGSWTATSAVNTPGGRESHTAIWTGSEMIVWGGRMYFR